MLMNVFRGCISTPFKLINLGSIVTHEKFGKANVNAQLGRDSMTESVGVDIVPKLEFAEIA